MNQLVSIYPCLRQDRKLTSNADDENKDPVKLRAAFRLAVYISLILVVVLILLVSFRTSPKHQRAELTASSVQIPLPLFFTSHIYSRVGFYVWVSVAFIWVFCESLP